MLVLTRRRGEMVYLSFSGMTDAELLALRTAGPIKVIVDDIRGDKVRLGFAAPAAVKVDRKEIHDKENPPASLPP